ncbi:MAG: hypothetical protein ACLSHC_06625 [Bilophila wadsworthia]
MERLAALPDDEAVGALCSLRCVDVRLAVRVLIGVLRRPDVLRFDDEAVRSGLMRVHGPRSCTQEGFEAFRARHAPFGSAATLCLWESEERLRPVFPCGGEALDALKRRDKRRAGDRAVWTDTARGGAGSVYCSRRQRDCTADFRKGRADDFRPAARLGGELYAARPCGG